MLPKGRWEQEVHRQTPGFPEHAGAYHMDQPSLRPPILQKSIDIMLRTERLEVLRLF